MDIALRAAFLYFFVVFVMRVMGRRELSSMGPFDLVLLIVLGDSIQQGLTQSDYSVTGAVIAVFDDRHPAGADLLRELPLGPGAPGTEGLPIVIVERGRLHRGRPEARADDERRDRRGDACAADRLDRRSGVGDPRAERLAQLHQTGRRLDLDFPPRLVPGEGRASGVGFLGGHTVKDLCQAPLDLGHGRRPGGRRAQRAGRDRRAHWRAPARSAVKALQIGKSC